MSRFGIGKGSTFRKMMAYARRASQLHPTSEEEKKHGSRRWKDS
jgi:hypothetical protein